MNELRRDLEFVLSRGHSRDGSAILVLDTASDRPDPATIERLQHEYALREVLAGPGTVEPLAMHQTAGRLGLVLADPGGQLLENLIAARRESVAPAEISEGLRIAISIATALAAVHDRGLIHKDICPANILVDPESGSAWLTGFGMAVNAPRERQSFSTDMVVGNLSYMAPEQTGRMNRSVDSRSDLYSLGVILYRMFSGEMPFSAEGPMEWIHCHLARTPIPLAERLHGLPCQLSDIIMKLLAKMAEERYQTASGLAADLSRCLDEWNHEGKIETFPLGAIDHASRLIIPERLYGREAQSEELLDAMEHIVAGGAIELVLVSGYSGIGKSALVNEVRKATAQSRALFESGKSDQYRRDIPYSTFVQAFEKLIEQILTLGETEVARWREAIQVAVGQNGQLIVDLIPSLAFLIGPQPPVPQLSSAEAQNRFHLVFASVVSVFAVAEHPLILFLDDLQWEDPATLQLLAYLVCQSEMRHMLLIGAFRDNEVGPAHPLMLAVEKMRKAGAAIRQIVLHPLTTPDLRMLVADALHCDGARAEPLADLIQNKTGGNPFFSIQFLIGLWEEGLVEFDPIAGEWRWDLDRIRAKPYTDNVVDFMAEKLRRLPDSAQRVLRPLACLGNSVSLSVLAQVQNRTESEIRSDFEPLVRAEFVCQQGNAIGFAHDRIQEATYALIPPAEKAAEHLRIGRALAAGRPREDIEAIVFDVVNQLNRAVALVDDDQERQFLCRLNVMAGRKAKLANAYGSAAVLMAHATDLVSTDWWESRHEEAFSAFFERSECEYLAGNISVADELFSLLIEQSRTKRDVARVHKLRQRVYQVSGNYHDAVVSILEALRNYGVDIPESDEEILAATEAERRMVSLNLAGRRIADLADSPEAPDPDVRDTIELLSDTVSAVYQARPILLPFAILKALNLSLQYGNTVDSCPIYTSYAFLLAGLYFDFESAFEFCEMALRLNDKFDGAKVRGRLRWSFSFFTYSWRKHIVGAIPLAEQGFVECVQVGNLMYAGYAAYSLAWMKFVSGEVLSSVSKTIGQYRPFVQKHFVGTYHQLQLQSDLVVLLDGGVSEDRYFEELDGRAERLQALTDSKYGTGIAHYHIARQFAAVIFGRHEDGLASGAHAAKFLKMIPAQPLNATHHFCFALSRLALRPEGPDQLESWRQDLQIHLDKLELWAQNCPENYEACHALVQAEVARVEERDNEAMRLYEQAVRSARENGFIHFEALANELAAAFYRNRNFETIAATYLRNARYCYVRWGAHGKVRQLSQRHPELAVEAEQSTNRAADVDLMTVVRASQAVSGEIVIENLIKTLLGIVVENAGASRGLMILVREKDFYIEAEAATSGNHIDVVLRQAPVETDDMPKSMLHYVVRTQEKLLLDDVSAGVQFSEDDYVRHYRPKSALLLPLVKQAKLIGLVYLENRLTVGAFTPSRLAVLEMLASQAAISLENAILFAEVEEHRNHLEGIVRERTAEVLAMAEAFRLKSDQVKTLLDNSGQGFMSFGADLVVNPEYSRACEAMLGTVPVGKNIVELLFGDDAKNADLLRMGISSIRENSDPYRREVVISLLPAEVRHAETLLRVEYTVLNNDQFMVVLTDITEKRQLEEKVQNEHRRLQMVVAAVTDSRDFFDTVTAFRDFVRIELPNLACIGMDPKALFEYAYRSVHTYKGTLNQFCFQQTPEALHTLEGALDELRRGNEPVTVATITDVLSSLPLEALFELDLAGLAEILGNDFLECGERVSLTVAQAIQLEQLASRLLRGEPVDATSAEMRRFLLEIGYLRRIPVRDMLAGFDRVIQQVANRKNKEVAPLEIFGGDDVWIDPSYFGSFMRSLAHVFRNAVAHGLEEPDERLVAGKGEIGRIKCTVRRIGRVMELSISDDGRGIDTAVLKRKAIEQGLLSDHGAAGKTEDILELIFLDHVSTTTVADQISGRGVGLAAVRAEVRKLGGDVTVRSSPGEGTSFLFLVPIEIGVAIRAS